MKRLTLYGLFFITTALILLDRFSHLEITNSIVYYSILLISIVSLTVIILSFWLKLHGDRLVLFSSLTAGFFFIFAYFLTWNKEWKTQTIMFQNLHFASRTIEFQMQDFGALGSNQRTIDRFKILPYLDWTKKIDPDKIDTLTWEKVNIDVDNKLGL